MCRYGNHTHGEGRPHQHAEGQQEPGEGVVQVLLVTGQTPTLIPQRRTQGVDGCEDTGNNNIKLKTPNFCHSSI